MNYNSNGERIIGIADPDFVQFLKEILPTMKSEDGAIAWAKQQGGFFSHRSLTKVRNLLNEWGRNPKQKLSLLVKGITDRNNLLNKIKDAGHELTESEIDSLLAEQIQNKQRQDAIKLAKKEDCTIDIVASYINSYINSYISNVPSSKNELIKFIKKEVADRHYITGYNCDDDWTKSRIIETIEDFSNSSFVKLTNCLKQELDESGDKYDLASKLESILSKKLPGEDFEIREFVKFGKNYYGIKIYLCGHGYLFDFEGTVEELADELIEEARCSLDDVVMNPTPKGGGLRKPFPSRGRYS